MPPRSADFLGFRFDRLDEPAVLAWAEARGAATPFAYVVTPNVDHVVRMDRRAADDPAWAAYRGAALCLCDSRVLARLGRLLGVRLPVVPGSDLTARLLAERLAPGDTVALVGGDEGLLADLERRWPDQRWVQHVPPMGAARNPAALAAAAEFVAQARARYSFLAIGAPQQELVAHAVARRGDAVGTGLCIGASIEFVTGRKARAPRWMRRLGIEWLHRLLSEPRRLWRRYLVEGPRVALLAWRWRRARRG